MSDLEEPLGGGYMNAVVRVGNTVRRQQRQPRSFVHDLLRALEDAGWSGAPRFLGFDEEGREVLSWIEGHVPWSGIDDTPGIDDDGSVAAAPGLRIHDVAHIAWQWAANTASSPAAAAQRIRVVVDAYGLDPDGRSNLVDTILWWQDRCWRGIQAQIDEANPAVRRLVEADAVGAVRADFEWTLHHRPALDAALL